MSIEIKKLRMQDIDKFTELIGVFEEVFEMRNFRMPNHRYLQQVFENKNFIVFVALKSDEVVGGLTAYILQQYYSELPLLYVYDLAVKSKFQRRGIGKMLMENLTDCCRTAGMEEVFVQADADDGHALEFYRSTGAISEEVVHFSYPLNYSKRM